MRRIVRQFVPYVLSRHRGLDPVYEFGALQVRGHEGSADMRPFFPGREFIGCDIRPGRGVDRIEDLHRIGLPDDSAGTVLVLETFEHVENPFLAMSELARILKPGGLLIATSVLEFPIHEHPSDYWRFTPEGFRLLVSIFDQSEVTWHGESSFPVGVYGWARKLGRGEPESERCHRTVPPDPGTGFPSWFREG